METRYFLLFGALGLLTVAFLWYYSRKSVKVITIGSDWQKQSPTDFLNEKLNYINDNYQSCSGFVFDCGDNMDLFGMATFISFSLEDLEKPVIFCTNKDLDSAKKAVSRGIPEVSLYYQDSLYRGCRPEFALTDSNYILPYGNGLKIFFYKDIKVLDDLLKKFIDDNKGATIAFPFKVATSKLSFLFSNVDVSKVSLELLNMDLRGETTPDRKFTL